ncbi:hypothetical protein I5M99_18525 [Serratia marcescens]|nr:hypothetical protein [Serratia marcescens]
MTLTTDVLRQIVETDHVQCGDAAAMARELLANREAQPVVEPYMYELWKFDETVPELERWFLVERSHSKLVASKGQKVVLLYTAPPAPAVPESIITAPIEAMLYSPAASYVLGWNACRAAMLAQPVSGGYKMPDDTQRMDWLVAHHVTVRKPLRYGSEEMFTAQTITDEEDDYHATKLREQIDAAMLAAATGES